MGEEMGGTEDSSKEAEKWRREGMVRSEDGVTARLLVGEEAHVWLL